MGGPLKLCLYDRDFPKSGVPFGWDIGVMSGLKRVYRVEGFPKLGAFFWWAPVRRIIVFLSLC